MSAVIKSLTRLKLFGNKNILYQQFSKVHICLTAGSTIKSTPTILNLYGQHSSLPPTKSNNGTSHLSVSPTLYSYAEWARCNTYITKRHYCSKTSDNKSTIEENDAQLSVFQRFKSVYKEYGKTLVAVHVVTSVVWYGAFYMIARSGIDLLPLLIKLGASEAVQAKFAAAGDFLVAYLIYEIAKPIRYIVTLAGTRQAVVIMRNRGYLPPLKPEDKLRNLAKDGRDNLREKYQERKDDFKEKYADKRAEYSHRWKTVQDRVNHRRRTVMNSVKFRRHRRLRPKR